MSSDHKIQTPNPDMQRYIHVNLLSPRGGLRVGPVKGAQALRAFDALLAVPGAKAHQVDSEHELIVVAASSPRIVRMFELFARHHGLPYERTPSTLASRKAAAIALGIALTPALLYMIQGKTFDTVGEQAEHDARALLKDMTQEEQGRLQQLVLQPEWEKVLALWPEFVANNPEGDTVCRYISYNLFPYNLFDRNLPTDMDEGIFRKIADVWKESAEQWKDTESENARKYDSVFNSLVRPAESAVEPSQFTTIREEATHDARTLLQSMTDFQRTSLQNWIKERPWADVSTEWPDTFATETVDQIRSTVSSKLLLGMESDLGDDEKKVTTNLVNVLKQSAKRLQGHIDDDQVYGYWQTFTHTLTTW